VNYYRREVLKKFVLISTSPDLRRYISSLMQSRWEEVGKKKLAQATTNASHGVVVLADSYLQAKIQVEGKVRTRKTKS
jgi:hypothetical protein